MIDLTVKRDFIKQQACFKPLSDTEIEGLAELLAEKTFKKGDVIVNEGDLVDSVYLIVSGEAEVRILKLKDNQTYFEPVAVLKKGDSVGLNETGFYSISGRRTATVVAMTDMVTLRLNIAEFHGFALANSHVSEIMRKNAAAFEEPKT